MSYKAALQRPSLRVEKVRNASKSWPNPEGFDPLKLRVDGDKIVSDGSMADYWERGTSIESRFLDMLIGANPKMKLRSEDKDGFDRVDLSSSFVGVDIDRNSKTLLKMYAKGFRHQCSVEDANYKLAGSYMVMLGKLTYSAHRYPLDYEQMKGIKHFLIERIAKLCEYETGLRISMKRLSIDELVAVCAPFLEKALVSLKDRFYAASGQHVTRWVHQGIRNIRFGHRLRRLEKDFSPANSARSGCNTHIFTPLFQVINHLPILTQFLGILLDTLLQFIADRDISNVLSNLSRLWYGGGNVEQQMAKNFVKNPDMLPIYIENLKALAFDLAEDLPKLQNGEGVSSDTVYLSHLIYLRHKILNNSVQIDMKSRDGLIERLDLEIIYFLVAPELGEVLNYDQIYQLRSFLSKNEMDNLSSITLEQRKELLEFLTVPQLREFATVSTETLKQLLFQSNLSVFKPLRSVLTDEQRAKTHEALVYLRDRIGMELKSIGKDMLTRHLTILDLLSLIRAPKSFDNMVRSYRLPEDPKVGKIQLTGPEIAEAIAKAMVISVMTPGASAAALAGILA